VTKACQLFLVYPETSSTPLSPPSSARSRKRAPSSNSFRIATYLDPKVGPLGTWERVTGKEIKVGQPPPGFPIVFAKNQGGFFLPCNWLVGALIIQYMRNLQVGVFDGVS